MATGTRSPVLSIPQPSTVPVVIAGLVSRFRAGITDDAAYGPTPVYDGPRLQNEARNFVAVGVGDPTVSGNDTPQNRGDAVNQGYDVNCMIGVSSGGSDDAQFAAHRARVYAILGQIRAVLAPQPLDPYLVRLGTAWSLTQGAYGEGTAVEYRFSVHVAASI